MKWFIFILLILSSCTVVVNRQHGLREFVSYKERHIIKIDTVWNEHGGVVKVITVKIKKKDAKWGELDDN